WQPTLYISALLGNYSSTALGEMPIAVTGGGVLSLGGQNVFASDFTVTGGSGLHINTSSSGSGVGSTPGSGPVGVGKLVLGDGSLLLSGASANAISNAVQVKGGFTFGGFNNFALNGLVGLTSDSDSHAINVVVPTVALTLGGVVSGSTDLAKTGLGTLVLGNVANDYTGKTLVQGGILSVATLRNGGISSSIGASSSNAGNLVLDGGNLLYTGVTISTDRLFTVGAAGGVIDVSTSVTSDTLTFASAGAVAYAGTGPRTLVLTGSNTGVSVFNPIIGDAGASPVSLAKGGAGNWRLNAANTYTGGTTLTAGGLTLGNTAALGTGAVTITGGLLDLNGLFPTNNFFVAGGRLTGSTLLAAQVTAQAGVIDINLTGAGGLVKNGAESLTLSGSNIFTGATFLNGGNLILASKLALPGGADWVGGTSNVTLAAGKLGLGFGDFARSLGTASDQTRFTGSTGFYALNADRTVNLGAAGIVLNWGLGGFIPEGSSLLLSDVSSANNVTFANPIALGGNAQTVRALQVEDGTATVDAVMTGALSGL
ncbi:MAG: hypothetical protein EBU72_13910, partial [Betaproteobacteria bacterium]|nr:hypothetical protein [Betaproteobacteria bacterium]